VSARTILVADDNQQIRMLVGAALRSLGHEIVFATDGAEALEKAIAVKPDLVLLDVTMPELSGFEVLEFLRKRPELADTRVMMLTRAAQMWDLPGGPALGCDHYLTKPFEPRTLREKVQAILGE
jgi:CheY-like chemotaxis protein